MGAFLLKNSSIFSNRPPHSWVPFYAAAHLFFPFILFSSLWMGSSWTAGAVGIATLLVGWVCLADRQWMFLWFAFEFVLLGFTVRAGVRRWRSLLRLRAIQEERLEGEKNTLLSELNHLQENQSGSTERLKRYQLLREIANTLSTTLTMEDLLQRVAQSAGEVIQKAHCALLYAINPSTLQLELQSVWRRSGSMTIKTKRGDPFDLWVMRQAQPLLVEDPLHDFRFPQMTPQQVGRPLGSLLAVPLMSEHRLMGVLRVESTHSRGLDPEDLRLARIVADLASLSVENTSLYQRMAELAMIDDLTGLMVRSFFQKRLTEELSRADSLQKTVSLLLIDIDHFKVYNDTFGHSSGDKLLKHVAVLMKEMCRPGEVVARFGGEEFVILLPGVNLKEAVGRAEWLRSKVRKSHIELRRSFTRTTISIGVATFPKDAQSVDALLRCADERLYQAKKEGRNRVCPID